MYLILSVFQVSYNRRHGQYVVDVSYLNAVEPDDTPRLSMKSILELREAKAQRKASKAALAVSSKGQDKAKWLENNIPEHKTVRKLKGDLRKEEIEEESE